MSVGVITISREFASGGDVVANLVAEKMGFTLVSKKTIEENLPSFMQEGSKDPIIARKISKSIYSEGYISALHEYVYDLAIRENLVILGQGGQVLFRDFPPSLHVKVLSSTPKKVQRVMKHYNLGQEAAQKLITEQDRSKKKYLKRVFGEDWSNVSLYDLFVNTDRVSYEDAADLISTAYHIHSEFRETAGLDEDFRGPLQKEHPREKEPSFMHKSEEEFARMLDFYRMKWEYEPRTFPLEWDSDGNVTEAFAPDFYLPEQDLYLELTTQRQKLVWKKNKKIRRLKELYPEVNIKIMYNKDIKSLMRKFGREDSQNT
jgi:cytidylate kinase